MSTVPESVAEEVKAATGSTLGPTSSVSGGCINEAVKVELDGRNFFLKWNRSAPEGFFGAESQGLTILRDADALHVPRPIAYADHGSHGVSWLLAEFVEQTRHIDRNAMGRHFGEGLAALHASGHATGSFGLEIDNFIGALPQRNTRCTSWVEFYRDHRLGAQLALGETTGRISRRSRNLVESIMGKLGQLVPDDPPTSLLHGDLWSGNYLVGSDGHAVLIDPAVYRGHAEVELAFTEMFGGFPRSFYDAYEVAAGLEGSYAERRPLYQAYPLLVHVNLFGGGYTNQLNETLKRYA